MVKVKCTHFSSSPAGLNGLLKCILRLSSPFPCPGPNFPLCTFPPVLLAPGPASLFLPMIAVRDMLQKWCYQVPSLFQTLLLLPVKDTCETFFIRLLHCCQPFSLACAEVWLPWPSLHHLLLLHTQIPPGLSARATVSHTAGCLPGSLLWLSSQPHSVFVFFFSKFYVCRS